MTSSVRILCVVFMTGCFLMACGRAGDSCVSTGRALRSAWSFGAIEGRYPGTPPSQEARARITAELGELGWNFVERSFPLAPPYTANEGVSLFATRAGFDDAFVFATGYDSPHQGTGRNVAASGVAALLEMARCLPETPVPVVFAFLDAEQTPPLTRRNPTAGLEGSKAFLRWMSRDGHLNGTRGIVYVDEVATLDGRIALGARSHEVLERALYDAAAEVGELDFLHAPDGRRLRIPKGQAAFARAGFLRVLPFVAYPGRQPREQVPDPSGLGAADTLSEETLGRAIRVLIELAKKPPPKP